jgi:glycerophosphoryl diester phosphodiesterase
MVLSIPLISAEAKTKKTILIGHRGYSSKYPENTTAAFNGAFKHGFKGIECDLWESTNGDLMVNHDATILKMAGVDEFIWNINSKNRKQYPITGGNNAEKYKRYFPTLTDTLKIAKKYNGYLFIHIKHDEDDGYFLSDKGVKKIIRKIKEFEMQKKTIVFAGKSLVGRFLGTGIKVGVITSRIERDDIDKLVDWCSENNVRIMIMYKMYMLQHEGNGKSLVDYCHSKNVKLGVYKTMTKKHYKYLNSIGADFALSDNKLN